jgi:predicted DsbA family dithiol-disulfide isomerase
MSLTIQVYSDYVWPYCLLAEFPLDEATRGKDVVVEWMPFELRPEPEPTLRPEGEYLQRAWARSVYPLARRFGVPIALPPVSPQPHTDLAFEGYQFAKEHGGGDAYNRRVIRAFFQQGQDIGRADVLTRLAGEVGLDERQFREALDSRRYREAHRQALGHAARAGITAVPTFVIGDQTLVGLQSREALEQAIDLALAQRPPTATAGLVCVPEGCPTSGSA